MILRNDIQDLPQGTDVAEKDVFYQDSDYLIREIYIRKKGKGNALNVGICHARNALICVIDADCILQKHLVSFAKAPYWESMDTISILLEKIWS